MKIDLFIQQFKFYVYMLKEVRNMYLDFDFFLISSRLKVKMQLKFIRKKLGLLNIVFKNVLQNTLLNIPINMPIEVNC